MWKMFVLWLEAPQVWSLRSGVGVVCFAKGIYLFETMFMNVVIFL
jgi:hypothetical protein